jgi:hypothetical protein
MVFSSQSLSKVRALRELIHIYALIYSKHPKLSESAARRFLPKARSWRAAAQLLENLSAGMLAAIAGRFSGTIFPFGATHAARRPPAILRKNPCS